MLSDEQNNEMLYENQEENDDVEIRDGEGEEDTQEIDYEEYLSLKEQKEKLSKYLKKANEEAKKYRLKVKEYEEAGFSPEELRELREKEKQRKQKELERKGDFEKLREQLVSDFKKKEQEYQKQIESLRSSMEKTLIQRDVTSAIAKYDGIEPLLRPHIEANVRLVENDDGTLVPRVVDSDGSIRFNSKGEYMTVEEYVASLRDDEIFGAAFKGRGQSGSGSRTAPTNGKSPVPKKRRHEMSEHEVREFVSKYGWDEYHKLPL